MRGSVLWAVALMVFGVGLAVFAFRPGPATAQGAAAAGAGVRYSVIDTEGTNLLVTDNGTNTLYYYTVDPGKEVGEELILRGSIDLNDVGKPSIKPRVVARKDK